MLGLVVSGGVNTANTASNSIYDAVIDGASMYIVGYSGGNFMWKIEKRKFK